MTPPVLSRVAAADQMSERDTGPRYRMVERCCGKLGTNSAQNPQRGAGEGSDTSARISTHARAAEPRARTRRSRPRRPSSGRAARSDAATRVPTRLPATPRDRRPRSKPRRERTSVPALGARDSRTMDPCPRNPRGRYGRPPRPGQAACAPPRRGHVGHLQACPETGTDRPPPRLAAPTRPLTAPDPRRHRGYNPCLAGL